MSKQLKPFQKNGRFYNDTKRKPESLLFETIPSFVCSLFNRKNGIPKNPQEWVVRDVVIADPIKPVITWIGHATFLIQINGINILTDPIFGNASFLYPRRLPPGIAISQLPRIDAVLISHNHPDHMDKKTLVALKKNYVDMQIFVPQGDKKRFNKWGFNTVHEFTWEQEKKVTNGAQTHIISCTFVPAYHWSCRGLFDKNKSLWGGWVICAGDTCIYFAGDTAYSKPFFKHIEYLFPHIDVALLPVAPSAPRELMKKTHIDAHEACQLFLDINAQHLVPMHWGTFGFGNDYFDEPIIHMKQWWQENNAAVVEKKLHILKVGQRFDIPSRQQLDIVSEKQPSLRG